MSARGLTAYDALVESVNARKRAAPVHKGVDQYVALGGLKLRQRRTRLEVLLRQADDIDALAPEVRTYADARLNDELESARAAFMLGRVSAEVLTRAMALVREAASRETGEEAYRVQLAGALALVHGRIAEMVTGEGKTLTGSLAVPLLAWRYRHVHVLTVNDYLAERDAQSRRSLFKRCGLDAASIQQEQSPADRAKLYAGPIVYGTPKEIAADYLRDQIRMGQVDSPWSGWQTLGSAGPIVPGLHACLVDEADAVLIDEGVTPLIIARPREMDGLAPVYERARTLASGLEQGRDYGVDHLRKKIKLTHEGAADLRAAFAKETNQTWRIERRGMELIRQALLAEHCYVRGQQYELVDGRVVIVDEYTGRFLPDRSWEHGLHQAVEAKEGVEITADRETLARISFQKFFRSYRFLAGMTGTAATEA
ncbi:MAG: preprotein translocase subunit SecA, partial [Planctomycetota bacterium]